MTLGTLYFKVQGYVPALLENLHAMACSVMSVGSWMQVGFSVSLEAFG